MAWGYTGYPGSTSSSVFHGQQQQPPRLGLLDRLAGRLSDFGYGSGEEDKRAALRRALAAMGARMASGALTEGTAALAPAIAQGFAGYQQGLSDLNQQHRQERGDELQAEQLERQNRIADAQIENYEADNQRAANDAAARLQARKDLIEGRRAALEKLTPEQRARLEPHVGDEKFDDRLWEITKPPEIPKPEGGFTLGEGQVRYGPDGKVIATGPPKTRGAGSDRPPWYGVDYVTRGNQLVKIDKNTGAVTPVYTFEGGGADPVPQRRAIAKDQYDQIVENWNPEAYPEYIKKGTTDTPDLRKIWDDQWKFAGNYVGGKPGPAAPAPETITGTRVTIPGDPEPNRPLEMRVQDVVAAFGGKLPPAVLDQVRRDLRTKLPREVVAQIRAAMGRR